MYEYMKLNVFCNWLLSTYFQHSYYVYIYDKMSVMQTISTEIRIMIDCTYSYIDFNSCWNWKEVDGKKSVLKWISDKWWELSNFYQKHTLKHDFLDFSCVSVCVVFFFFLLLENVEIRVKQCSNMSPDLFSFGHTNQIGIDSLPKSHV